MVARGHAGSHADRAGVEYLVHRGATIWPSSIGRPRQMYAIVLNPDTVIRPGAFQTMLTYSRPTRRSGRSPAASASPAARPFPTVRAPPRAPSTLLLGYTFLGTLLAPWSDRRRAADVVPRLGFGPPPARWRSSPIRA
jgi:GT2 family glycosyltransferase